MAKAFIELSEDWFDGHGVRDPAQANAIWRAWLDERRRVEKAKYKMALALAAEVSSGAVGHYLYNRTHHLSEERLKKLDEISISLGYTPPERPKGEPVRKARGLRRVALLTELTNLPSPSYHMEVIHGVIRGASRHHVLVTLHEVFRRELRTAVERIAQSSHPDAIIMLRLTPDAESLQPAKSASIPVVLVHADRARYSEPVLTNIIPFQKPIERSLLTWARALPSSPQSRSRDGCQGQRGVVVVAMPHEAGSQSIRNERIILTLRALRRFKPVLVETEDYSFRQALKVFQQYPNARAYVCLSDEIAVGIKHLLIAAGKDYEHRILGFDDSLLAKKEQITSIDQRLEELGERAMEKLEAWFTEQKEEEEVWPEFEEVQTDIYLAQRD